MVKYESHNSVRLVTKKNKLLLFLYFFSSEITILTLRCFCIDFSNHSLCFLLYNRSFFL